MADLDTRITEEHCAALRALILDPGEWKSRFSDTFEKEKNFQGYSTLFSFAISIVIHRTFPAPWSLAHVIRNVADLRITFGEHADFDPRLTEEIIRFYLGDASLREIPFSGENQEEAVRITTPLFMTLVAQAGLDEAGVDELINEAADNAREFDWSSMVVQGTAGSPEQEGGTGEDMSGGGRRDIGGGRSSQDAAGDQEHL